MWHRVTRSFLAIALALTALSALPAEIRAQSRGVRPDLTGGFTIARLKYTGGGDWYSDETSLRNLLRTLRARGDVRVAQEKEAVVTAIDPELWNYPMLFMTGHGNVKMSDDERKALRAYLDNGGFLWADDNFGLDPSFRALMKQVYPDAALTELPFSHTLYRAPNVFAGGPPKIHEHDGGKAQVFALHRNGRIVVLYTYNTDIGNGIEDPGIHDDKPEKRDLAMRFAVNIAMLALSQ
ncbi:MAG TPA: DUF4159 domain-containing protein [Candidatus Eisenbacteria bacterium]|nr:DUF4159 domain-containing protein [Candidatus Eisenbacteria bacterium]